MAARSNSPRDAFAGSDPDPDIYPPPPKRRSLALHERGVRAGRFWAENMAKCGEIYDLLEASRGLTDEWSETTHPAGDALPFWALAAKVHAGLRPVEFAMPGAAEAFWGSILAAGERGKERHDAFVLGFLQGVLSAWIWMHRDSTWVPLPW